MFRNRAASMAPAALVLTGALSGAARAEDGGASSFHSGERRAEFILLGDLPGGLDLSYATAISRDGTTVVGASCSSRSAAHPPPPGTSGVFTEAFRWQRHTAMVPLGDLPGDTYFHSAATAVSADGRVVVGSSSSGRSMAGDIPGVEGFRWTSKSGMYGLGVLINIQRHSPALAVSDDGNTIAGCVAFGQGSYQGYLWTPDGGMVGLGNLGGYVKFGFARALSASGAIVVGSDNAPGGPLGNQIVPAVRTAQTPWAALVSVSGSAKAISADGLIVVGEHRTPAGHRPFRWSADSGLRALDALPGFSLLNVAATSSDTSVIVGASGNPGAVSVAWVWAPHHGTVKLADLAHLTFGVDLEGWILTDAAGVSGDGRTIVGTARSPEGRQRAYLLHLPDIACTADINHDGTADNADLEAFLEAFEMGSSEADVYPDHFIDGIDYDTFMRGLESGC